MHNVVNKIVSIKNEIQKKIGELQKKDYVVFVKRKLPDKDKEINKDLDFLWGKFKK